MRLSDATYQRDLGDGLVLRWARAEDIDGLATMFSDAFRDAPDHPPNPFSNSFIREIGAGRHPLADTESIALVEDRLRGGIAAAAALMSSRWAYEGIPFTIGRPEPVATHADYRRRGLVRAIFELLHARSAARGDLAQAITGIPYFYRQFGYEYAIEMSASRLVYFDAIPQLKAGTPEPYSLREATAAELPLVVALHERELAVAYGGEPVLLRSHFDADYWSYMRDGFDPQAGFGWQTLLIEDAAGQVVGYALRQRTRWSAAIGLAGLMTEPGTPLSAVLPSLLRGLRDQVDQVAAFRHDTPPASHIRFYLGRNHIAHTLLSDTQASQQLTPYAWYVRVPELPQFLRHIAPALEKRLERSPLAGYSGELRITFYQGGLRLVFTKGRLDSAEHWHEPEWEPKAQAGFPPLVFLQLLFGYRSLHELEHAFPDVSASDEAQVLLTTLFPRRQSWVLAQD